MILPCLILLFLFAYVPLIGYYIAFQRYVPAKGLFGAQQWVGWKNFEYLFALPDFADALRNTLVISSAKLVLGLAVSVLFALLINEVLGSWIKRTIQTVVYFPHFLSWIILAGVFIDILSPSYGLVNRVIEWFGGQPVFFLGDNTWFPIMLVTTDVWKEFGFGTIVYLAAITSINPALYEAATVDGASKWRQILHITLPGIMPIMILMALLNLNTILSGNFDQVFNLYSPQVYRSGDILDTLVYRIGLEDYNFSLSTAAGLFKSAVSLLLISVSYYTAYKVADYRIF